MKFKIVTTRLFGIFTLMDYKNRENIFDVFSVIQNSLLNFPINTNNYLKDVIISKTFSSITYEHLV